MSLIPAVELANEVDDPVTQIISAALVEHNNTVQVNYQTDLFTLPSSIKALRSCIEVLHLDNNYRLRELTSAIGELGKLRWLNVNYCALENVNVAVSKLTRLERLHLSNNQLTFLPPELGQLHMLNELHVDNNKLRVLPVSLLFLPKLRELTIENNPLLCHNDENEYNDYVEKNSNNANKGIDLHTTNNINSNSNNNKINDVPKLPYVYCDNCRILTPHYSSSVSFHNLLQFEMLPFVQYTCSTKCTEHLHDRLEKYDCEHRCCNLHNTDATSHYDKYNHIRSNEIDRGFFSSSRPLPASVSVKDYY